MPNQNDPKKSKYRCRICHGHFRTYASNPMLLKDTPIALPEGILLDSKDGNRDQILNHATNSKIHRDLINAMKTSGRIAQEDLSANIQISDANAISARVFDAVFLGQNSLGISLDRLSDLLKLLKVRYNVELGKGCTTRWTQTRIMKSIATSMHSRLVLHIQTKDDPLVLLFDGSTDKGNLFNHLHT